MKEWIIKNAPVLVASIIGVIGALLGVIISSAIENKRRRKEAKDRAKPILINCMEYQSLNKHDIAIFVFESEDESSATVKGVFKNTDNGILLFDYIETETKKYYPVQGSAVGKNEMFVIILQGIANETLKKCRIYCHDIYGIRYFYDAKFLFDSDVHSEIIIQNEVPIEVKGKKQKKST